MKSLNRQTVNKLKKMTTPAAIFMIISTIISGIGTVLKYKTELFPSACPKGWVPYDNYCYLDTKLQLSAYGAVSICNNYDARLPKANFRHLRVAYLTYGKVFWVSLTRHNNRWSDINTNKTVDMNGSMELIKLNQKQKKDSCFIYKSGEMMETLCNIVNYIICVKRFYN
ncbi:EEV protein [Deerpox virus W-1170-84]|uniref:EEV protein n=2 Tax=Mule deerpox virus TaxID=304399 RepID=Q08FL9_DPV83|nr:EEV protein [Deerpox virus W-848-83]ABI99117.1 EEV protein [Deerpox virus W-1170-84]ABI99288.1 EEV protein [Deerpox virus W-848-83]AUI80694.1 EEv glycoprotein [White-tailed deer poxvirus]AYC44677.1 EEV protein [Moosepox virus GoldyGopher14]